ncbi:hypothetical protein OXH62_21890 [Pseudomonas chlororaphis]|uniref:hypothetical protein n=1 Tax=Pseudomonas chlororaphis TaxID=587753 RepID=UPI0035D42352
MNNQITAKNASTAKSFGTMSFQLNNDAKIECTIIFFHHSPMKSTILGKALDGNQLINISCPTTLKPGSHTLKYMDDFPGAFTAWLYQDESGTQYLPEKGNMNVTLSDDNKTIKGNANFIIEPRNDKVTIEFEASNP